MNKTNDKSAYFCSLINVNNFDVPFLYGVLEESPWFSMAAAILIRDLKDLANMERVAELRRDYSLAFSSNSYSATSSFLKYRKLQETKICESSDIIDSFLDKSPKRIKLGDDSEPLKDNKRDIAFKETDQPILNEHYAEILISQGYYERAKEIYIKLSLKNPEKSVYFAQLIEKIDRL